MPWKKCLVCSKEFYTRPNHLECGWGKFCSKPCQSVRQKNGRWIACTTCGKNVYRTASHAKHSQSGKFFCSKSCFAKWKNRNLFLGERHGNWRGGENTYRRIMMRSGIAPVCANCTANDFRVLLVHHKDRDRKNNAITNLVWLCHNCHFLEHLHDKRKNA